MALFVIENGTPTAQAAHPSGQLFDGHSAFLFDGQTANKIVTWAVRCVSIIANTVPLTLCRSPYCRCEYGSGGMALDR